MTNPSRGAASANYSPRMRTSKSRARHGKEAVRLIQTLAPDLVFLDIRMPELDGFAVLRELEQKRMPAIIFVTAYDTFAVRAFEARALDYLVKPVGELRFKDALLRARERLRSNEALELSLRTMSELAHDAPNTCTAPARRLMIGTAGADLVLDPAEIAWIEADDYYAAVHAGGRRHLVRESLASLEARLDRRKFVRAHRRVIVNLAEVREIRSQAGGEWLLVLKNGSQLPLSRRRRHAVDSAVRRFAG
jgi:two-component system LytT family response regulator